MVGSSTPFSNLLTDSPVNMMQRPLLLALAAAALALPHAAADSSEIVTSTWHVAYMCPEGAAVTGVAMLDDGSVEGVQLECRSLTDPDSPPVAASLPGTDIIHHVGTATSCLGMRSYATTLRYAVRGHWDYTRTKYRGRNAGRGGRVRLAQPARPAHTH